MGVESNWRPETVKSSCRHLYNTGLTSSKQKKVKTLVFAAGLGDRIFKEASDRKVSSFPQSCK